MSTLAGSRRCAVALALFLLGGASGAALMWHLERPTRMQAASVDNGHGGVRRAAVAHSVYVPELRHPVEVTVQEEDLARWLTQWLESPVRPHDLRAEGFELVGALPKKRLLALAIDRQGS
jgi:anti-sigma factor RsiW